MPPSRLPPSADIREILDGAENDLVAFRGARMLVTGGTGFVGTWFLRSLIGANAALATRIRADVLTRDPERFTATQPQLAEATGVRLIRGDVVDALPSGESYDAVVHAATPASAAINNERPREMLETIVRGGANVLALAEQSGPIPFLFTSSGAVYGPQPPDLERIPETYLGGPDPSDPRSAYHEGKRIGELQCAIAAMSGLQTKIARLFAFVGPNLPIDRHFAAGNFIRDALNGGPIRVGGDGRPYRSYLYPTDLTVALWRVFARGVSGRPYNIGSDHGVSIAELARRVAEAASLGGDAVTIAAIPDGTPPARYVPDVSRAAKELGLRRTVELEDALRRTLRWHRALCN